MRRRAYLLLSTLLLVACSSITDDSDTASGIVIKSAKGDKKKTEGKMPAPTSIGSAAKDMSSSTSTIAGSGPGFPEAGPWITFYGTAKDMGDLSRAAERFRIINIEADPDVAAFTDAQIRTLQSNGKNKVISYLNIGACERWRTFWSKAPTGFVGCGRNTAAQLGAYEGFDEMWMNPANAAYRKLVVEHIAQRLVDRGVDGFFLDNMELLAHGPDDETSPCDEKCVQGGFELIRSLRERYPDKLIVQNNPNEVTRTGKLGDTPYVSLIDGVVRETLFYPEVDNAGLEEIQEWSKMPFRSTGGHPFWVGVLEYVGSCTNTTAAKKVVARAEPHGVSVSIADSSAGLHRACYWDGLF